MKADKTYRVLKCEQSSLIRAWKQLPRAKQSTNMIITVEKLDTKGFLRCEYFILKKLIKK